jgi:hypothetical protein
MAFPWANAKAMFPLHDDAHSKWLEGCKEERFARGIVCYAKANVIKHGHPL